jgi:hypothetical protein
MNYAISTIIFAKLQKNWVFLCSFAKKREPDKKYPYSMHPSPPIPVSRGESRISFIITIVLVS